MGGEIMSDVFKKFKEFAESEESYTEVSISNMQNRIIDLLKDCKMKKSDLAKKMGISKQQLNDFFNKGYNATFKTIGKVAHALDKKVVISFVEKDTDNKKFYNYVRQYKNYEASKPTFYRELLSGKLVFGKNSPLYRNFFLKKQ